MGDQDGYNNGSRPAEPRGTGRPSTDEEVVRRVLMEPQATHRTVDHGERSLPVSRHKVVSFAQSPYPILLQGESGTGKTILARAIHDISRCATGPFVSLSLGGLPEELCYATLCGSKRGSYTGSIEDQQGYVAAATRGTLFLDELGFASNRIQQTLLTILETQTIRHVGATKGFAVDARFIFATSSNLKTLLHDGRFLIDLYHRVSELTLELPPLRQQRAIIVTTAESIIRASLLELRCAYDFTLSEELKRLMTNAPWPGNFRELRRVCRNLALSLDRSRELVLADLPHDIISDLRAVDPEKHCEKTARGRVLNALNRAGGNKAKAARDLSISRGALYRALERSD